jgi:8-oxo-dGTP diphosphatase
VLETAVVHRPKYDDWSLPKGKPEPGEHLLQTAHREVLEETGLSVILGRRSVQTRYSVGLSDGQAAAKEVDYWTAQWTGGDFMANDEVDELRWLPIAAATALVSHEHDRAVLADLARTDIPLMPALLLVRHARAGDPSAWEEPDRLRPLDDSGRAQAARFAEVLPLFHPVDLLSVPRVRCVQTVEPLAERLGLGIRHCPELGEKEFPADPQAGMALVERLLDRPVGSGVTVACSQGGAIPSILLSLGIRREGRAHPPAPKGSVWALGGRSGAMCADYYRNFDPEPAAQTAGKALGSQADRPLS